LSAGTARPSRTAALEQQLSRLDPERYPNFARVLPVLMTGTGEERFEFGLRLMIEGLPLVRAPATSPWRPGE
jgi:Tetracyclin repressor-like, C-terminal domain